MWGWLRRRRSAPEIPDALWRATLQRYPFLAARSPEETGKLRALAAEFLASKEFHGAGGLAISDEIALAIAAQAVLPVLHLGLAWYDDFVGIVVHPDEVLARRSQTDESGVVHDWHEVLAGEAMDGGPVMLNWHDVAHAGASAETGFNVVIHEFVHKIDLRDGAADGCPPLPSRQARARWLETLQHAYQGFREQVIVAERFGGEEPWLDAYGATAIDEFFAVACEAYFVNRERFGREFAELTALFDGFYLPKGNS
ncbi:M90 family metallopeptidase [Ramlibacter alkalitolerans]|uniref:Zinc-dependent peptidase n=1 Tax=Ramlibacter alkalitolerans TaxID=2039631 RepID=A0ABS1JNS4_9BURK|nr:M90 family metallopeptidase [Ramlibacter alkalitolerans]MBL0425907.1 zinc-dependent peptidase [Ramlibacter alkalitolerans]